MKNSKILSSWLQNVAPNKKDNTHQWFVDAKGILKQFEQGEITDSEYLDSLQKNADNSGIGMDEYVRKINGGLRWEIEAKEVLKQFRQGQMTYKDYEDRQVQICAKYDIDVEKFVSFVNNIK